jgi:hypothetical protein
MADPTFTSAVAAAVIPYIKSLTSGAGTLEGVAEAVAKSMGRSVSVGDVMAALRVHAANGVAHAQSALQMSQSTLAAADLAASKAAEQAAAKGLERAAVEAAKNQARRNVLNQSVKQVAQRTGTTVASRVAGQTAARAAGTFLGLSTAGWALLGGGVLILMIGGYIYSQGESPVAPGARMTGENCPEEVRTPHKCPWSPDGYTVGECTPGFCFDTGPQGTYACKQESDAPNARRTDLSDVVCDPPLVARKDPCTKVILACE